jgi:hypothetical protein
MSSQSSVYFYDQEISEDDVATEIVNGFRESQKRVSPKYF